MDSAGCIYIFMDEQICIHVYVTTIKENEAMQLMRVRVLRGHRRWVRGRKGKKK